MKLEEASVFLLASSGYGMETEYACTLNQLMQTLCNYTNNPRQGGVDFEILAL